MYSREREVEHPTPAVARDPERLQLELGIDASVHDPFLSRRGLPPLLTRIAWHLRELTVPFEIGRSDVVFTPLANVLPLASRLRALPVVVVNYGLNLIWQRSSSGRRALLGRAARGDGRVRPLLL